MLSALLLVTAALALQPPAQPDAAAAPAPRAGQPAVPGLAPASGVAVIDTIFPVRPNGRLVVEGVAGTVRVRAWNRAEMQLRTASGRAGVAIRTSGDVVRVGPRGGGRVGDDIEVRVPAGFSLTLSGHALSADIEGVNGVVQVNSANGAVTVRRVGGSVRAETLNGAITLEDVRGEVNVSATNHRIELSRVQGRITAATVNGAIHLRDVVSNAVALSTVNGAIDFRGAVADGGRYRIGTHNGAITLALPPATNATLVISTLHGRVSAGFPVTLQPGSVDRRATYTIGNGSASIELESFNGNIRLVRP